MRWTTRQTVTEGIVNCLDLMSFLEHIMRDKTLGSHVLKWDISSNFCDNLLKKHPAMNIRIVTYIVVK